MSAVRRDRALLALAAAGVLGAAASAGTLALWTATASGEGSIAVERYADPARGLAESATAGPAESSTDGLAESPTDGPGGSTTDHSAESPTAGPTASATQGRGPAAPGGPGGEDTPGSSSSDVPTPDQPPATVRIDLPRTLVDEINAYGRGAALIEHGLTDDELRTYEITLTTDVPDLTWRMEIRTVESPGRCTVTDVEHPLDDGTPVELELGASTLLCLDLEADTSDRTGHVSVAGTSEVGDVSDQEGWAVTVHDTLTHDDVDVVLTPDIEVSP